MILKSKKGLIGKIFAIIGIIFLIIILILGITAYQVYSVYNTAKQEIINTEQAVKDFQSGDCSKVPQIEQSIANVKSKAKSACKNPLISLALDKLEEVPFKCKDISSIDSQFSEGIQQMKNVCANQTKISQ